MKTKTTRRICILLAVLLVLAAFLAVWQGNNLKALVYFITNTSSQLEEKLDENDQVFKDTVQSIPDVTIRDVTEEEKEALQEGELTSDELLDRLLEEREQNAAADRPPESTEETEVPSVSGDSEATTAPVDHTEAINQLVARVYVLRETYTIELNNLRESAMLTYWSNGSEEIRETKNWSFIQNYLNQAVELETRCDAQMDQILAELEQILTESGQNLSLLDTVKYTYANEKSLKKAWYMSELQKRGWF